MNDNVRQPQPGNEQIGFLSVVMMLLRKIHWLLIAALAFGVVVWLGVTLIITPTYESRVSFYVYNTAESASASGTINSSDLQAAESLATTYSKILESNTVMDAVLSNLRSDEGISRKDLSEMVSVSVVTDTQLLEVIVETTDAQLSCDIATAFSRVAPTEIVRITKAGGVEIVDRPEVADEKASPRTLFDTVIGAVIGVLLAAVLIVIRAHSDETIYLPEDVESMVGATVLGQIPEIVPQEGAAAAWKLVKGERQQA